MRRFALALGQVLLAVSLAAAPIVVRVDATAAGSNTIHTHLTIPAAPGPLLLHFPKWIPGEHDPSGPINGMVNLHFTANGAPVVWTRDPVEMFAFHVTVPAGASALDAEFDFVDRAIGGSSSPRLAIVSWNTVVLYPDVANTDTLEVEPSLRIPQGWSYATALETRSNEGGEIRFENVSLTTLIDSPVQMATDLRKIDVPNHSGLRHTIDVASESAAAVDAPADFGQRYGRLVDEATALFGANHYRHYDWLLSLSPNIAHFGLEHHESSDDRTDERTLIDDTNRTWVAGLLAHEFAHSWNGKYRRPAGLATGNYHAPMQGELLWVYEGLTTFFGSILPYRAGLFTAEDYRDALALTAAEMEQRASARTWRPLRDTAVAAQLLYGSGSAGAAARRSVDFYPEGELLWLDADMTIRKLTGGKKSLDDFCRAFYGGTSGHAELKPYTFDDVVAALNGVVANDWAGFLDTRLNSTTSAPMGGIEGAGWKLVYNDKANVALRSEARGNVNVNASLGFSVNSTGGIMDVVPGTPAARAGIVTGARVIAVNGRRYSADVLKDAVKASVTAKTPIELITELDEFYSVHAIDYHGGTRYPHLERIAGRPDLLEQLGKPLAPPKK